MGTKYTNYQIINKRYDLKRNLTVWYTLEKNARRREGFKNEELRIVSLYNNIPEWKFINGKLADNSPNKQKIPRSIDIEMKRLPLKLLNVMDNQFRFFLGQ